MAVALIWPCIMPREGVHQKNVTTPQLRVDHLEALRHLADIHMADTPVSTEDGRELVRCRRNKQWPSFLVKIRKGCGIQQNIGLL